LRLKDVRESDKGWYGGLMSFWGCWWENLKITNFNFFENIQISSKFSKYFFWSLSPKSPQFPLNHPTYN
jgi:hypothetical protein